MSYLKKKEDGVTLSLLVQAGAKKNHIVGLHGEFLKIQIQAPRVEGQANIALIAYFSKIFKYRKSSFSILHGEFSNYKTLHIRGASVEELSALLESFL